MKIAVYGSASDATQKNKYLSSELGNIINKRGHVLISGACPGLPYEATCSAYEGGGITLGFSPASNKKEQVERFNFPLKGFSELRFIPQDFPYKDQIGACLKYRNVCSVAESDAAIFIQGRIGSLNEFTICYDCGKLIGLLSGTGGA